MTFKFPIALASSFCTLILMTGVADAGKGGGSQSSGSSSSARSTYSPPARLVETKKFEVKKVEVRKVERSEVKIAPKFEPKVERIVKKPVVEAQKAPTKVLVTKVDKASKVALNPQPLPPKESSKLVSKVALGAAAVGGAHLINTRLTNKSVLPTAPMTDRHKHITEASMHKFVVANAVQHNAQTLKPTDGIKHKAAVQQATQLIKDPTKGYKVAVYGDKSSKVGIPAQPGKPAGDNSTIVINGNNKTVYVPASTVGGPDNRTIIVNCNHCKIVVVGNTSQNGQPVVDNRNIVVNGSHDKVILQGDKANGGTGQAGGSVTDNRHVTVSGDKNKIAVQGDSVNGGGGANSTTGRGQDGGNGGKVTDNRQVDITATGDKNKVSMGGDSANGGNGGNGKAAGGNGGAGGDVVDKRQVNDQGDHNKVDTTRTDTANGGNGGSGQPL